MACGGSRTGKGDAIRAVFGAPVEIVLKREALKHAPHLGRRPVRYVPGERVLATVSGFPEERPDREGAPSDEDWSFWTSHELDFTVTFRAEEVERVVSLPGGPLREVLLKGPFGFSEGPVGRGEGRLELVALLKLSDSAFSVYAALARAPREGDHLHYYGAFFDDADRDPSVYRVTRTSEAAGEGGVLVVECERGRSEGR